MTNAPSWTEGYVSDTAYTLGFYREMAPAFLDYAALINGHAAPPQKGMRYCELGCGRGYGTLVLAAANPDQHYVGIDFNPEHIGEARGLAERAGIGNVRFLEASFGDAARGSDAEPFDIVALHGVYSWVSPQVQEDIHEFLRRRLAPGGLCYVSYNTLPGWAALTPLQYLLNQVADRASGDTLRRLRAGIDVLKPLSEPKSGYVAANPLARRRLESLATQPPEYLAHEYMNQHWRPLYVTEAMAQLAEAKLSYVGSAAIGENRTGFSATQDIAPLFKEEVDPMLRELLKDFAVNKQFRRDMYGKGTPKLANREIEQRYDAIVLAHTAPVPAERAEWVVPAGSAKIDRRIVDTLLRALETGPASIGTLRAAAAREGIAAGDVPPVIEILVHNRVLTPCRNPKDALDPAPAKRLNTLVFELALASDGHSYLASPLLGSGIGASYPERLFAPMVAAEAPDSPVGATEALALLARHDKKMDDQPGGATAREKLERMIGAIRNDTLPRWAALGIDAGV